MIVTTEPAPFEGRVRKAAIRSARASPTTKAQIGRSVQIKRKEEVDSASPETCSAQHQGELLSHRLKPSK